MDLMEARRRILIAQPHHVTLSGGLVHFQTDMDGLMQITGTGNITVCGKNLFDGQYPDIAVGSIKYRSILVGDHTVTLSTALNYSTGPCFFLLPGVVSSGASTNRNGVWNEMPRTVTAEDGYITIGYLIRTGGNDPRGSQTILAIGSSASAYEAYTATTAPAGTARKSLVGINNIWSDSGSVTVTYWTH